MLQDRCVCLQVHLIVQIVKGRLTMSSTFQALSQPQPYAAMVHSSMYRNADMGTRLSKLNSNARKPCLQQHSTAQHSTA
jgi:hypothetical protein